MRKAAFVLVTFVVAEPIAAQESACPEGALWEPYTMVCAEVRDVRDQFLSQVNAQPGATELPVPGTIAVGTTYRELPALESGRLHTKMFVHPDGLQPSGDLPLFYTTATSRVQHGLEVIGIYWRAHPNLGRLGLWAWPCFIDYPCPDGDTSPGWQWITGFPNLPCNITHGVDQGGHAQRLLYYANHTDKLDDEMPPLWKSALYLWNYCDEAWDLAWEHTYREDKVDCSVAGSGCGWWGPGLEIFGEDPYPQIAELGYEDSLLYHDGLWSELRWPEAGFRDPATWATTPWQLFHLDPNRGYGVGNQVDVNDPPIIEDQQPLETLEDEVITIDGDSIVVSDPDVDQNYHVAYSLTVYGGDDYTHEGRAITPLLNFAGRLSVPITVGDGAADSQIFELRINVTPVNDPPVIMAQNPLETGERTPLTIELEDVLIDDPDNDAEDFSIAVQDGPGYQRMDNTITPDLGIVDVLPVNVIVDDGALESEVFPLLVNVMPDLTAPVLTLSGSQTVSLVFGSDYTDAGASAVDDIDGDITDSIVIDNPVNTARAGTYTILYQVSDLAGNTASITRTVIVNSRPSSGGGGGSADPLLLALIIFGCAKILSKRRC